MSSRKHHHRRNDDRVSSSIQVSIPLTHHLSNISQELDYDNKLTPRASPFSFSPWVSQQTQSLAINFNSPHDAVSMKFVNTLSVSSSTEDTRGASEQEFFIDFEEFLFPEVFFVENICGENLGGNTSSQVFKSFSCEASFNCSVILISQLGIEKLGLMFLLRGPWHKLSPSKEAMSR